MKILYFGKPLHLADCTVAVFGPMPGNALREGVVTGWFDGQRLSFWLDSYYADGPMVASRPEEDLYLHWFIKRREYLRGVFAGR